MKKLIFLFPLLFLFFTSFSQENPVRWNTKAEKINETEYNLIIEADIQDGWCVYSQYLESDDGPVRTAFVFNNSKNIELIGKNEESGNIKKMYDQMFEMNVIKFAKKGVFTQKIKVKTGNIKEVTGMVTYMCCDDNMCLPPKEVPFRIVL